MSRDRRDERRRSKNGCEAHTAHNGAIAKSIATFAGLFLEFFQCDTFLPVIGGIKLYHSLGMGTGHVRCGLRGCHVIVHVPSKASLGRATGAAARCADVYSLLADDQFET
jgi:hypothetical protein